MNRRIADILGGLNKILDEQKELFEALPRALKIMEIWPEAYMDGLTCSPVLIGTNYSATEQTKLPYPRPYHRVREIKRTFLRRKDGVEHDITIDDFFAIIQAGPE
jgi:hypothetical protein